PKQGGDNYEAAYAEVQYSSSNNKFATNAPDPEEGGDGKEATHQELGYSSGADKSMYDTEDPREDMDWEEESGGEFEDPLYIWPLEEYSSGTQGESVQPKATDIKGKKKQRHFQMERFDHWLLVLWLGLKIGRKRSNNFCAPDCPSTTHSRNPFESLDSNFWGWKTQNSCHRSSVKKKSLPGILEVVHVAQSTTFSVDLQGYVHSKWNRSAAQVFAMEYLKHYKGKNHMLEFMAEAWLTWVAGMKAQYKHLQQDKVLYKCHLNTACQYANIKDQAICIVQSLGLDGMSSNESDHEGHNGEATYYILDKDWHSQCITAWLWLLDALHLCLRYSESVRAAVRELPSDFYSHNWYQAQNNFMKGQLKVTKPSVSLEVPTKYLKLLEWYNLSDCWCLHAYSFYLFHCQLSHCYCRTGSGADNLNTVLATFMLAWLISWIYTLTTDLDSSPEQDVEKPIVGLLAVIRSNSLVMLWKCHTVILPNSTFCSIDNSQWHQVPLVTLPDALLQNSLVSKCGQTGLYTCIPEACNAPLGIKDSTVLRVLNQVCGRWQAIVLEDPLLWHKMLNLTGGQKWVREVVMQTKDMPLWVHINQYDFTEDYGKNIMPNVILSPVTTSPDVPSLTSRGTVAKLKEILEAVNTDYGAPLIHSLSIQNISCSVQEHLVNIPDRLLKTMMPWHNVTLAMMLLQLSLILPVLSTLADLQLQDVITVMAGNLGTTLVALQGLSSLHIWSSIDACTIFLGTICAPSLVTL
ncbi:hypothetical protein F5141DRAFT_1068513, partial [Pisolithus sp. B1]